MALTKCTSIKEENIKKDNLIENLRTQIKEWQSKYFNSTLTSERLAIQLSKKPAFISSHDWYVTGTVAILSVILSVILTLQLME